MSGLEETGPEQEWSNGTNQSQRHQVHPKFRNEIPEVSVPFAPPLGIEHLVEWKAPYVTLRSVTCKVLG